ncbi:hypothetical protein ACLD02_05325 [Alloalcanivorax sp. C16-2]|uniref:hypothetical protein n=1 Tax=Alloalcanivorax TaxID=3020832 RepID=UPI0019326A4A|nr:hypothetical protein [Alloalcanivorax marinus]MBL7250289.1 hypothetical protein [Alloalcanivorax marinus]
MQFVTQLKKRSDPSDAAPFPRYSECRVAFQTHQIITSANSKLLFQGRFRPKLPEVRTGFPLEKIGIPPIRGTMILLYFLIALAVGFLISEGVQRYLARRREQ